MLARLQLKAKLDPPSIPWMKFPEPLIPGCLVRHHKRFLADVELENGEAVTVHCPNPGFMLGLDAAEAGVWLSPALSPSRKLRYTLELVRAGVALVGVNTNLANRVAEEAFGAGRIPELAGYQGLRREVRIAADIDPGYSQAFAAARMNGVEMLCYACKVAPEAIELAEAVAIDGPCPG